MQYSIADIQRYVQRFYGSHRLMLTPFAIPILFDEALASGQQLFRTVNVQANADFVLLDLSYKVNQSATIETKSEAMVTLLLRESGSKAPFTDSPVMLPNYASNGIEQRTLPYPRFLAGATSVEAILDNVSQFDYTAGVEALLNGFLVRVFN